MEHVETQDEAAADVLDAVRSAAFVFYADGHWRPFADDTPESRVTKPADTTHVQFNSLPGRPPHAEYRGPHGRWWVRIDPETGMPVGGPVFVPPVDSSSRAVN
jgi:hypothetical protein